MPKGCQWIQQGGQWRLIEGFQWHGLFEAKAQGLAAAQPRQGTTAAQRLAKVAG